MPDAVVSSYVRTGANPWTETAIMGTPLPCAQSGSYTTTNQANENAIVKFNYVDAIGHTGVCCSVVLPVALVIAVRG